MYSVVLMMALSGGADTPEFGRCNGCSGARCQGCHGRSRCHGCHGGSRCHGCHGGCHGRSRCHGCHGRSRCHGCHGCHGAPACHGCTGGAPVAPPAKKMPKGAPQKTEAPAVIMVSVPADARLTVDGLPTTSTSAQRTFITPALPQGESFVYTLRAEVIRDGRTMVETQQVTVRGGEETRVPFSITSDVVESH